MLISDTHKKRYVEIGEPDKKTDITILWARPGA